MQRAATAARRSPDARAVWDPHVKRRLNYQRVQKHYDALAATGPTPMLKEPWNVSLDNRQPKSMNMKHLKVRAKKAQLEAERFAEVEMENRNLLRKMTHIMNNDPLTRRSEAGGLVSTPFLFRSVLQALNIFNDSDINRPVEPARLKHMRLERRIGAARCQRAIEALRQPDRTHEAGNRAHRARVPLGAAFLARHGSDCGRDGAIPARRTHRRCCRGSRRSPGAQLALRRAC